ncbi:hypothetical protein ABZP36_026426 [Zizania latifolia]
MASSSSSLIAAMLVVVGCAVAASAFPVTIRSTSATHRGGRPVSTTQLGQMAKPSWLTTRSVSVLDLVPSHNALLLVQHDRKDHTVTEVSKSEYDACAFSGNPSDNLPACGFYTSILSLSPGTHYYICTVGNHCANGMKLAITVSNSSSIDDDTRRTQPWSPFSSTPTTGASARLHAGAGAVVAAVGAVLVKLALF